MDPRSPLSESDEEPVSGEECTSSVPTPFAESVVGHTPDGTLTPAPDRTPRRDWEERNLWV